MILIGTYWVGQFKKWKGYYNYPISDADKIDPKSYAKINELWLFNGTKAQRTFVAEFVGVKTRKELVAEYKYPAKGSGHGDRYLLFKIKRQLQPSKETDGYFVRTKDFAGRSPKIAAQLKAYLESPDRKNAALAAKLPRIVTKLPASKLIVGEEALQMDFLRAFDAEKVVWHEQVAADAVASARKMGKLTCVEICAGAGGQAIGLDRAGFEHVALVEYEQEYCDVLKKNKPKWNVICGDVHKFDGKPYAGVDLLAGGVPCPPFSVASKQLGKDDERDLFPEAIRLISEIKPRAVMLENVRGLLDPKFDEYRNSILQSIRKLGYKVGIKLLQASDYGVPQIRPRVVIVGIRNDQKGTFSYPAPSKHAAPTVGRALKPLMGANGWRGLDAWVEGANKVAPTIVGGSKKHGGPDLGPTRARRAWAELGVDGLGIGNEAPAPDFVGRPKLTKEMIAVIQGFPRSWDFGKRKTAACRMIGNAFPPPVAQAVGEQIRRCLTNEG